MHFTASRKTGAALCAIALAGASLAACSNDSADSTDSTEADSTAAESGDAAEGEGRGPITFAMGRNDTDKLIPILSLIHI